MIARAIAVCTLVASAGCTGERRAPSILPYTDPYAEPDAPSRMGVHAGSASRSDRLRDAALLHLDGMRRRDAVAWLEADGFACEAARCVTSAYDRDTWFERAVPSIRPFPTNGPNARRIDYRIDILGDRVNGRSSLATDVTVSWVE